MLKIADIARGSVCVTAMGIDGGRGLRHEIVGFVTQCTWNAKSPTKPPVTQAILGRLEWNMTASISKVKSSIEKKDLLQDMITREDT